MKLALVEIISVGETDISLT